jgi:hypothetical protein
VRLWHGGAPDLRPGDLIRPGHQRRHVDGCAWCEARAAQAAGGPTPASDPLARHSDRVYLTTERAYARFYASLYGRGDLYRVEAVGELEPSQEDPIQTWMAPAARVVAVVDRAVLMTMAQRRQLLRLWTAAEHTAGLHESCTCPEASSRSSR